MKVFMKTAQLECFYAINKYGSIRAASKALGISQSAVSQTVQKTEKELNIQLLDRSNKSVAFTPAGTIVAQKAIVIHDELCNLENRLSDLLSNESVKTINLGFCDYSGLSVVVVTAFNVQYPQYRIITKQRSHMRIIYSLEDGQFDLCITFSRLANSKTDYIPFGNLEFGVAIPKGHTLYFEDVIPAHALKDQSVLLPLVDTVIVENIKHYFRENDVTLDVKRYAYALDPQISAIMLENTGYVTFLPYHMDKYMENVSIKRLEPSLYMELAVIWSKNKFLTKPLQTVIEFLGGAAAQ